jgi:hypothetical protein
MTPFFCLFLVFFLSEFNNRYFSQSLIDYAGTQAGQGKAGQGRPAMRTPHHTTPQHCHTGYSAKDTNNHPLYVAARRMLDFPGGRFKYLDYLADPYLVAIGVTSQLPTE